MNTNYVTELPPGWSSLAAVFTAMGDPQRQRLLLAFEPGEKLTAGQLASVSPLNRTTVSHHLKVLRLAGVLSSEKKGLTVYYWVNREIVEAALTNVLNFVKA